MQTPAQAARRRDDTGGRLPQPWRDAEKQQVFFRRGQLSMLVAAPGVGKSVLATAYTVQSGVRCLYLSMDTDAFTTSIRLVAAVRGCTMQEAEEGLSAQARWALDDLATLGHVHYAFTSSPDEREIADRMLAYREAEGEFPELVVVDNLANVAFDDEEFAGSRRLMRDLQTSAHSTGTAILVLHHATGEHENGDDIVPLRGVSGKLSKFPSLILTAHRAGLKETTVSVVKNRFGKADPSGLGVRFTLSSDMERVQVSDNDTVWRSETYGADREGF